MTGPFDVEIRHVPDRGRYEAVAPGTDDVGAVVGFLRYDRHDRTVTITNTVVLPEFRGHGVADALTHRAVDDARAEGSSVRPECWYVEQWIHRRPEYHDVLATTP
ncbi:GNAT family N-acetyltransferase [Isoptericola jiangsuensis]|uniref:GNAT family N-acetyltransferase n=1 Tax=Isoptericola jiangsuensis TaxID=548579 RepID=UPI003AAE017A